MLRYSQVVDVFRYVFDVSEIFSSGAKLTHPRLEGPLFHAVYVDTGTSHQRLIEYPKIRTPETYNGWKCPGSLKNSLHRSASRSVLDSNQIEHPLPPWP